MNGMSCIKHSIFSMTCSSFSQEKDTDIDYKNNYEILIYYVNASFVQEIWKDTGYRI